MTQKQFLAIRTDLENAQAAESLSRYLDAPVIGGDERRSCEYLLTYCGNELTLEYPGQGRSLPLVIDYEVRGPARGRNPLVRAMGKVSGTVIDMTAGWCMDAVQIASAGFRVVAMERSRLVVCLVEHALARIHDQELLSRISLHCGDSLELLMEMVSKPEIIYLDPMYPLKQKSAASRKNISILRKIAGVEAGEDHGPDAEKMMLQKALDTATRRVVVKRPHYAPPIHAGKVGEVQSKLVRFDIYKPQAA